MKTKKLSMIVQTLLAENIRRERVQLAVGELILHETQLRSDWQQLTAATPLANTTLELRVIPASQQCMWCFHVYHPQNGETICPQCRGVGAKILAGEEFYLE